MGVNSYTEKDGGIKKKCCKGLREWWKKSSIKVIIDEVRFGTSILDLEMDLSEEEVQKVLFNLYHIDNHLVADMMEWLATRNKEDNLSDREVRYLLGYFKSKSIFPERSLDLGEEIIPGDDWNGRKILGLAMQELVEKGEVEGSAQLAGTWLAKESQ